MKRFDSVFIRRFKIDLYAIIVMEPIQYVRELHTQLNYLVAFARSINELDMAGALLGEMRGAQDPGWNTSITAYEVFNELKNLGNRGEPLSRPEIRHVFSLYSQLSEAGGVYEGLLSLMKVIQLRPYNMWPFQDLVRVSKTKRIIGPNSNAMFRRLAETATAIGMKRFAELLNVTFRDDIRNGIFHADYILWQDGMRLRRRNGGQITVLSNDQLIQALQIALFFFELLDAIQREARLSFRPEREIIGRFSSNPPMSHRVEYREDGSFSISTDCPGVVSDANYDRQERINHYLGGKVFTAYTHAPNVMEFLESIEREGFYAELVTFQHQEQLDELVAEIETKQLWDRRNSIADEGLLLATPFGFQRINNDEQFRNLLPTVEELEIG